jgi:hypothetical protein
MRMVTFMHVQQRVMAKVVRQIINASLMEHQMDVVQRNVNLLLKNKLPQAIF